LTAASKRLSSTFDGLFALIAILRPDQVEDTFPFCFSGTQLAFRDRNLCGPPPLPIGLDPLANAYCRVCHTLKYSLSGAQLRFLGQNLGQAFRQAETLLDSTA
jgi:hypothetical protein